MRLVAGAVAFALFARLAAADDIRSESARPAAAPATATAPAGSAPSRVLRGKPPLRVVRVMPESRQALLFDSRRATHVLAEVGGQVEGYTVDDIDRDTVTLHRGRQQVVLVAPARPTRRATATATADAAADGSVDPDAAGAPPQVRSASAARGAAADGAPVAGDSAAGALPMDPYAPVDPYSDAAVGAAEAPRAAAAPAAPAAGSAGDAEPGIRVAHAPGTASAPAPAGVVAGEDGVRVAEAPDAPAASTAPTAGASEASDAPVRVVEAPGAPASAAPAPAPGPATSAGSSPAASPEAPPVRVAQAPDAPSPSPSTSTAAAAPIAAAPIAAAPTAAAPTAGAPTAAAPPASTAVRAADAARAPDKQTLDARALADVMTTDRRARSPRGPEVATGPTGVAEVRATPAPAAAPAAAAASPGGATAISRTELDGALADFAALTAAMHASFSSGGVVVETVGDGSIFQRAGLRAGDVIASVDGVRLRSLDDAANLYARAATARTVTAEVIRGGKPVMLRVVIR